MSFRIFSAAPEVITFASEQPSATTLDRSELLACFPAQTTIDSSDGNLLTLDDAPMLGLVSEILGLRTALAGTASHAEVVDFYGDYKLMLKVFDDTFELTNAYSGELASAPQDVFDKAARIWSIEVLRQLENRFSGLRHNEHYNWLKDNILSSWENLPRSQETP